MLYMIVYLLMTHLEKCISLVINLKILIRYDIKEKKLKVIKIKNKILYNFSMYHKSLIHI